MTKPLNFKDWLTPTEAGDLRAEIAKLRTVATIAKRMADAAHPMWAPELRAALAALSESEAKDG